MQIKLISFLSLSLLPFFAFADVIIGPSQGMTGPILVDSWITWITGGTRVISTSNDAGANVTASILNLDPLRWPSSPDPILFQTENGNALNAIGGTINATYNLQLKTVGGHAVLASGNSSIVNLANTSIQTTGTGAGLVAIGGTINATGVVINNLGNSSSNVSAGHGAIAENGGIITLNAGTKIATGAFNAVGLGASGSGSKIITTANIPIVMNGQGALAIYLLDGGQVQLTNNSILQLNASNSVGVTADNTNVSLDSLGRGLTINFNAIPNSGQAGGTGIVALNGGTISLENINVRGVGASAGALAQANSTINLTGNSQINVNSNSNSTFYTLATAFLATASGQVGSIFNESSELPISGLISKGGIINSIGTTINVSSNNGIGAYAASTLISVVNIIQNTITTTGFSSFGLEAGENGRIYGINSEVTTTGGGAGLFLFASNGYGRIDLTNSSVQAIGADTSGIASLNLSSNFKNIVNLNKSYLSSEDGAVMLASGGPLSVNALSSTLTTQNGLLIDSRSNAAVALYASQSRLAGNARAENQSFIDMQLTNNSFWSGASFNATNISLDSSSIWSVTSNSNITQLLSNSGLMNYITPVLGFTKIITQNYFGANGKIAINTFLGSDGSPSDQLVINGGTAAGNTSFIVKNTIGPGALTEGNGILIVDTINGGTTSPDAFKLGAPVLAGPYEYELYRSSLDGTNDQNWYLRNNFFPGDPQYLPSELEDSSAFSSPHYRNEIGLYPILPAMVLLYGQTLVDTLHQRLGQGKWPASLVTLKDSAKKIWGRIVGFHGERKRLNTQRLIRNSNYDYNFGLMQIGGDLLKRKTANGGRNHLGIYGAFGRGAGKVHSHSFYLGNNEFTALSLGGYWTLYSTKEAYIDAVIQGSSYYDMSSTSYRMLPLTTNGWGFVSSIEGGYPFIINSKWIIEPQIQGIYEKVGLHKSRDTATEIQFNVPEAFMGRIGTRLAHKQTISEKILTTWFSPNLWRQLKGNPTAAFTSASGFIPFQAQLEGTTLELNFGATLDLPRNFTLYANGSYGTGLNNLHLTAYDGRVGFKVKLT